MSRIQELPDTFDSSQPLPPSAETPFPIPTRQNAHDATSATTPALPPAMDSVRSYTADEIVNMMKRTPLFMTEVDELGGDGGAPSENIELEALRALQYEGTRAEIALGFKERGNEMVGEKKWSDAREFYTKGIAALKKHPEMQVQSNGDDGDGADREGKGEEEEEEKEKERKIEEACYVNRALCNLEMSMTPASSPVPRFPLPFPLTTSILTFHSENYRSTLHDTSHTLTLSPTNTKAHYRSTLALLALNKYTLALDTCDRGLALTSPSPSPSSPTLTSATKHSAEHIAFQTLKSRILSAQHSFELKEQARKAAEQKKKKEELTLNTALSARGIKMRWTGKQPDLEDARIHLEPDPLDPASELHFPLLVLYPLHNQSDFLKSVAETSSFGDVLETVLGAGAGAGGGLHWDIANEYRVDGVEVFMETSMGGMVKVGRKKRVLDVLAGGRVEVLDGV
ncbi:MAG: hypothetical protein Q9204_008425, partial [Flavoplaca sp. TL-2023a]